MSETDIPKVLRKPAREAAEPWRSLVEESEGTKQKQGLPPEKRKHLHDALDDIAIAGLEEDNEMRREMLQRIADRKNDKTLATKANTFIADATAQAAVEITGLIVAAPSETAVDIVEWLNKCSKGDLSLLVSLVKFIDKAIKLPCAALGKVLEMHQEKMAKHVSDLGKDDLVDVLKEIYNKRKVEEAQAPAKAPESKPSVESERDRNRRAAGSADPDQGRIAAGMPLSGDGMSSPER